MNFTEVIIKPLLTEKSSQLTDNENIYCFKVKNNSNKNQIKNAVEKLFDVKVLKVNTVITASSQKRYGRFLSRVGGEKKAYVKIESGQKIELFKSL